MRPLLLVAEGDAESCEVYREFLAAHHYGVETAADGLECLEKLRRLVPAVLVLDRQLRWGGGDGVLAWLREQRAAAGVPVVLTAAADGPADVADDLGPPVVKLLPKPFPLTALLESVRTAVAERAVQRGSRAACSELFIG
jgi:CheY-like chemotaxis protein